MKQMKIYKEQYRSSRNPCRILKSPQLAVFTPSKFLELRPTLSHYARNIPRLPKMILISLSHPHEHKYTPKYPQIYRSNIKIHKQRHHIYQYISNIDMLIKDINTINTKHNQKYTQENFSSSMSISDDERILSDSPTTQNPKKQKTDLEPILKDNFNNDPTKSKSNEMLLDPPILDPKSPFVVQPNLTGIPPDSTIKKPDSNLKKAVPLMHKSKDKPKTKNMLKNPTQ